MSHEPLHRHRRAASPSGAGSHACTSTPRARRYAAHDAPMVPAPMTATRFEQVVPQPYRKLHRGRVGPRPLDHLPCNRLEEQQILVVGRRLHSGQGRGGLREKVRRLNHAHATGVDPAKDTDRFGGMWFILRIAQEPLHDHACVKNRNHGRPARRAVRTSSSVRACLPCRRGRIRRIASWLCLRRRIRSTASRMRSATIALLLRSLNVSLKASLTSSGTLKLTVAINRAQQC